MHRETELPPGVEPPGPDTSGFEEAVEVLRANLPFNLGAAVECLARAGRRAGTSIVLAELATAQWHIGQEIASLAPERAETGGVGQGYADRSQLGEARPAAGGSPAS